MACTVGIDEAVNDGSNSVNDVGQGVEYSGGDGIAAHILNGWRCITEGISNTRDIVIPVIGYVVNSFGQLDVIGESPRVIFTITIFVSVCIGNLSCTICYIIVDDRIADRLQHISAGIGNCGKGNGIGGCLIFAIHGSFNIYLISRKGVKSL